MKGLFWGPKTIFGDSKGKMGGSLMDILGFWKKNWNPSRPFYAYQISAHSQKDKQTEGQTYIQKPQSENLNLLIYKHKKQMLE